MMKVEDWTSGIVAAETLPVITVRIAPMTKTNAKRLMMVDRMVLFS